MRSVVDDAASVVNARPVCRAGPTGRNGAVADRRPAAKNTVDVRGRGRDLPLAASKRWPNKVHHTTGSPGNFPQSQVRSAQVTAVYQDHRWPTINQCAIERLRINSAGSGIHDERGIVHRPLTGSCPTECERRTGIDDV